MMNWSVLCFEDVKKLSKNINDFSLEGSDCAPVNIFLLQKKYDIRTSIKDGFLFRYYTGNENRTGYGFPIRISEDIQSHKDLRAAIEMIVEDAKENNRLVKFCLLTENQKNQIQECARKFFPDLSFEWKTERNDSDYIYSRKNLAELAGKKNQKKKNHVSKFLRKYEGNWEFRSLSNQNVDEDLVGVAESWLSEKLKVSENDPASDATKQKHLQMELESIKVAVKNKKELNLAGGVLYAEGKPVAITLASRISDTVLDVHYEKCLSQAAQNGAYAAINWCFANAAEGFDFLNREEDMGIEGLRKSKLSYHPEKLLEKYYS